MYRFISMLTKVGTKPKKNREPKIYSGNSGFHGRTEKKPIEKVTFPEDPEESFFSGKLAEN